MKNVCLALAVASSFLSFAAHAAPPTMEIYYHVYNGTDCSERADKALAAAGFEGKKGTFAQMDHVGAKGDYKGVVSCLNNKNNAAISAKDAAFHFVQADGQTINLVIFIVSGPAYKEANKLATEVKKSFGG